MCIRDSYFSHRAAALGGLNQPGRVNPSPPPHTMMGHSRTPSLTMQANQPPRDQRSAAPSQAQQSGHGHALPSNPYAQPSNGPTFSQPPPPEARNHAHHSHHSSLTGTFSSFHRRDVSRDEAIRQEQHAEAARRDRENQERIREAQELEHLRQREQYYAQARQQQQQQQQQQEEDREREMRHRMFSRGPPPPPQPLQPPAFNGPAFVQERFNPSSIREQAQRETEAAMRQQQQQEAEQRMRGAEQRMREEAMHRDARAEQRMAEEARHREAIAQEQLRFRQQGEAMFRRQTPLGGNYGHPPPQPPRR